MQTTKVLSTYFSYGTTFIYFRCVHFTVHLEAHSSKRLTPLSVFILVS